MKSEGQSSSNSDESSSEDVSYVMAERLQKDKNSDCESKENSTSPHPSFNKIEECAVEKKKNSDLDSSSDDEKHTSRDEKKRRSKSPHKRSKRSSSRHRRDRSRRSRSRSRHRRRRRSGSKERKRRSKSRSRDRHRSPKRSRRDSTRERQRSSEKERRSSRRDSSQLDDKALKKSGSSVRDRNTSRSRSRDRTRARDSRRRSRSRGHRRSSRSRSRDRRRSGRSRSKDRRKRRSKSRSRERRRRRSPSSSHKRLSRSASTSPYRFGFNKAMDAQERLARRLERAKELTKLKKEEEQQKANGFLGLKDDKLKEAIEKAAQMITGSGTVLSTPTMSAQASAQMAALRKQAEAETGVAVPTYYNPLVVNPMMFAQQQAKRNKLWSKKETESKPESSKDQTVLWSKTSLGDEKSDEKFAKLMGIKQLDAAKSEEEVKKRQELFSHLDMQYEQARVVTHTQRGAGLGFASNNPNTLLAQQANQQLNPASSLPPKT